MPVESGYLDAVRVCLETRALRIPLQNVKGQREVPVGGQQNKKRANPDPLTSWAVSAPLFVAVTVSLQI